MKKSKIFASLVSLVIITQFIISPAFSAKALEAPSQPEETIQSQVSSLASASSSVSSTVSPVLATELVPQATAATLYKVQFYNWDGSKLGNVQEVSQGGAATAPTPPTRDNFTFVGWNATFDAVQSDLDIYPVFDAMVEYSITIQYLYADGSTALAPYIITAEAGSQVLQDIPSPEVAGYVADIPSVAVNIPEVSEDVVYTVKYIQPDTSYTVKYYLQNIDQNGYTLKESVELPGKIGEEVTATEKSYIGFSAPTTLPSETLVADALIELEVYYTRNQYCIYVDSKGGSYIEPIIALYEAPVLPVQEPIRKGYSFTGWNQQIPAKMPANDIRIAASWAPQGTVEYTLVYWLEKPDGEGHDYVGAKTASGQAGSLPQAVGTDVSNITFPIDATRYEYNADYTITNMPKEIQGDGSTIVNLYYSRKQYTINFEFPINYTQIVNGVSYNSGVYSFTAKYGAYIGDVWPAELPILTSGTTKGNFIGWNNNKMLAVTRQLIASDIIVDNPKFNAEFNFSTRPVAVTYNFQNISGVGYTPKYPQSVAVPTDTNTFVHKVFQGFTFTPTVPESTVENIVSDKVTFNYSRNKYSITFHNGNILDKKVNDIFYEKPIGTEYYIPTRPSNVPENYVFRGWYTVPEGHENAFFNFTNATMPYNNLILYSKWSPPTFEVTFNPNNGQSTWKESVVYQGNATEPATTPVKNGYVFKGWRLEGSVYDYVFSFPVIKNMVLTAEWEENKTADMTVIYKIGATEHSRNVVHNLAVGKITSASAISIAGYLPDTQVKNVKIVNGENLVVFNYTAFTSIGYTVRYLDKNNTPLVPEKSKTSTVPVVEETFVPIPGYYPDIAIKTLRLVSNVNENVITFYYNNNGQMSYTVSHYLQEVSGGYTLHETETKTDFIGANVKAIPQTYAGYTYNKQISIESKVLSSAGTSLRLYYQKNTSNIKFGSGDNGTIVGEKEFNNIRNGEIFGNAVPQVPTPKPDPGYKFVGWGPDLPDTTDVVDGDVTYNAKFEIDPSQWGNIEFNANGGTGTMQNSTEYLLGAEYTLPANGYEKIDFDFIGWNTQPDGKGESYADQSKFTFENSGKTILYAQWAPKTAVNVAYFPNGGHGSYPAQNLVEGNIVTIEAGSIFTRAGYQFVEWNTQPDGKGTVYTAGTQITLEKTDIILYAQWQIDESQWVTYEYSSNSENATGKVTSDKVLINSEYTVKENGFSLEGNVFDGWNLDKDGIKNQYMPGDIITTPSTGGVTITLFVKWQEIPKYTITYVANNGTDKTFVDGPYYEGTQASVQGEFLFTNGKKPFLYWSTTPEDTGNVIFLDETVTLDSDITLYALWGAEPMYIVVYMDGFTPSRDDETGDLITDGIMTDPNSPYEYQGEPVPILVLPNPFAREGYSFMGWLDYEDTILQPGDVMQGFGQDIFLTALWKAKTYTITYDLDGGTEQQKNPTNFDINTPPFHLNAPKKPGYIFDGWTLDNKGTPVKDVVIDTSDLKDKVYVANWEKDPSQWSAIIFQNSDKSKGSISGVQKFEGIKGQPVIKCDYPTTNPFEDYLFGSWSAKIPAKYPDKDIIIKVQWKNKVVDKSVSSQENEQKPNTIQKEVATKSEIEQQVKKLSALPQNPSYLVKNDNAEKKGNAVNPNNAQEKVVTDGPEAIPDGIPETTQFYWALFNLLMAILSIVLAILSVFMLLKSTEKEHEGNSWLDDLDESGEEKENAWDKKLKWYLALIFTGVLSVIIFLLTEDLTVQMRWVDQWSILMGAIFLFQLVFLVAIKKIEKEEKDEKEDHIWN